MKCASCGADVLPGAICEYCGSTVDAVEMNGSRVGCFGQVKRSPEYARRNAPERLASVPNLPAAATIVPLVGLALFIAVAGFMTIMCWMMSHWASQDFGTGQGLIPLAMSIVPMAMTGLGIFAFGKALRKSRELNQAPVEAEAVVIVAKRIAVTGGSNDGPAATSYHVTAEFEDGRRREFQTARPDLFGRLVEDDAGVLFFRADMALDFDRVSGAGR
ncbi:MAG: DUF2500 domain-containing protein [Pirellulales bacterium]|nr:DUF2500 domain-containing protein [Pirellulales bacterium]